MGDRDGSPRLSGRPATARWCGRRRKDRSPPDGDEEERKFQVGPPEEAPEELVFLTQFAAPPGGRRRGRGPIQEGPQKELEPAFGQDQVPEATPDLVSQDRVADGLRTVRLANTGRSKVGADGGWQQCRPPFLFWNSPRASFCLVPTAAHRLQSFISGSTKRVPLRGTIAAKSKNEGGGGAGRPAASHPTGNDRSAGPQPSKRADRYGDARFGSNAWHFT